MEIGVNKGGTFYLVDSFLRALNTEFQYSVALDVKNVLQDQEEYFKKYSDTKIILGDSKKVDVPENFDMILIDGDHKYESVKRDFEKFKDKGTYICFHDTRILHRRTNVKKLWEEISDVEYNKIEFINTSPRVKNPLGIGFLIKK
jgi:hypothetical protein